MLKKDYLVRRTQNMVVIICFTQFKSTYKALESNRLEVFLFLDEKQSVFQIIYIYLRDVQKFPLRYNFCTSERGLHPQICQSVFAPAKTFNTSADWQNSLRKASFQRKLRQSALRYAQCYENDTTNIDTNTSDISKSIRTK